jgi:hypothetical protein
MMLAMAVLGFLMGVGRMAWLASRYRDAARNCATLELWSGSAQRFVRTNSQSQNELAFLLLGPLGEDKVARAAAAQGFQHSTAYYGALKRKYEQAAASPWSAVDADPSQLSP